MVSYDKNFQLKFEVTMAFIMMSCYYVDNLPSMKNARAYACGLVSNHTAVLRDQASIKFILGREYFRTAWTQLKKVNRNLWRY